MKLYALPPEIDTDLYPILLARIPAGLPSSDDGSIDGYASFTELCNAHPSRTFLAVVEGYSMKDAGLSPGDWLIIDRFKEAVNGSIVLVSINGELTVKRFQRVGQTLYLLPDNPDFQKIEVQPEADIHICGVATHFFRKLH